MIFIALNLSKLVKEAVKVIKTEPKWTESELEDYMEKLAESNGRTIIDYALWLNDKNGFRFEDKSREELI